MLLSRVVRRNTDERVRALATLVLTVLIMWSAVLTTSLAFVAVSAVVGILVYVLIDRLEARLAAGLPVRLLG
jgi:hypothetical protein